MNFGTIILNQSIKIMQNYVKWIQTASLFILEDISNDVKNDLTYQIIVKMIKDHFREV